MTTTTTQEYTMTTTLTARQFPTGTPALAFDFPEGTEGHGLTRYVITVKPGLRRGSPMRHLVWLVLVADGRCLNDNRPVASYDTLAAAVTHATV